LSRPDVPAAGINGLAGRVNASGGAPGHGPGDDRSDREE